MSIEFRLKFLREAIDKNVNEILLKWNAKKVFLNEPFEEVSVFSIIFFTSNSLFTRVPFQDAKELCPACANAGKQRFLKYSNVNMEEAVYKCESTTCLYPFRNFKYKNFVDRTIFRYERVDDGKTRQSIFTSPTKIENNDMDCFNVNWLDDTFTDDLDSILSAPSDGQSCDMKDIIANICNGADASSSSSTEIVGPTNEPVAKLSKCYEFIKRLSPTKGSHPNKAETMAQCKRSPRNDAINESVGSNNIHLVKKSGSKNIRTGYRKNKAIRPVKPAFSQDSLELIEWLQTVSRKETTKAQKIVFGSPTKCTGSLRINDSQVCDYSDQTATTNTPQPILIELMHNPDSKGDIDIDKPCLLYQLDTCELMNENNQLETIPGVDPDDPMSTEDLESILSGDHVQDGPAVPNVERFVTAKSFASDSRNKFASLTCDDESRVVKKTKDSTERNVNPRFNIEADDAFHGFEPVGPFTSVALRQKDLVWLKS